MTLEELRATQLREDKALLEELETVWLGYEMLKVLETDPVEKTYWTRLEKTADELIIQLQNKMVRRYL